MICNITICILKVFWEQKELCDNYYGMSDAY